MVPVWSLPLFVSGLLAAPPVVLEGAGDCPSASAILRELERIVAAPTGSAATDTSFVALEGSELRIVLTTKDGRLLGERRLPADGNCDERALSVAVVLGAWIATAHPEYLSTLPDAETRPPASKTDEETGGEAAHAGASAAMPSEPERRTPDSPPKTAALLPVVRSRPVRFTSEIGWHFQMAVAAGAELSEIGLVPALEVSLRYAPEASGLGGSVFALLESPEVRTVGSGRVSSFRWPLGAGGLARLDVGAVAFELDAGLMLGLLHVQGKDFTTTNDGATDVQGGAYGAMRVARASGRLRPFASAKLLAWFGKATAEARLPEASVDLPAVEGVFLLGLGYVL